MLADPPSRPTQWQRQPSPLARLGCAAWIGVVVWISLTPFSGWRDIGIAPFDFLFAPPPRYITSLDIASNVAGYLPLGALLAWSLHPRLRGATAVIVAALLCALLSGAMEALQTWLPNRVSSNLDLAANAAGGLAGALLGAASGPALLDRSRLRQWRNRWYERDAAVGLVIAGLWLLAQIPPQTLPFGTGRLVTPVFDALALWAGEPVEGPEWWTLSAGSAMAFEAASAATGLAVGVLFALLPMRARTPAAPRLAVGFVVLLLALVLRCAGDALMFSGDDWLAWMTPGARLGCVAGAGLALLASLLPAGGRRAAFWLLLGASVAVVNVAPDNPYLAATFASSHAAGWRHVRSLLAALALAWPAMAIGWLGRRGSAG
ncbi:VanZ family protein [Derxia gummosa]|uniref:VanZ family protein n=1 Tax=Derxia gummosa DSM 723 TaxID=1121388 RepID=A0A8B6XAM7_9BURK|nr:VanZ family protein [Derxia gummosa]